MRFIVLILTITALSLFAGAYALAADRGTNIMDTKPEGYPIAIFAGGCFWCVESEFRALDGVLFTRSGYIGGHIDNPKYDDTHDSKSGHAEAVEVTFDPEKTDFKTLATYFLSAAHDPTQLNRQGPDVGTQYRSAIFYTDDEQKKSAQDIIADLTARKVYKDPIVTTLEPAGTFWEAEDYHQQYYEKYEEKNGRPHINDWLKRQKRRTQ